LVVKFGALVPQGWILDLPNVSPADQFSLIQKIAREAERLGFDSIYFYDHFHTIPQVSSHSCFECWTTLAALAATTSKIRLGQMVTCNLYRNPAVLAKMASVLDVISGGRVDFGIGAGWYDHECIAYGIPFEKASVRIAKLEEAVQLIKKMWTEPSADFQGKYYRLKGAINSPMPIQKPHPPITIGGEGEQLLLKVVAKFADRCNFNGPLENYRRKLEVLQKHCTSVGRNFGDIEKTILTDLVVRRTTREAEDFVKQMEANGLLFGNYQGEGRFEPISAERYKAINVVGNPNECLEKLRSYREIGVGYFIFDFPMAEQLETMKICAEQVVAKLR
jgi:F420-dependent oxidoreductase-like protein